MKRYKILLLGCNGFIGSNLLNYLINRYPVICAGYATEYDQLDKLVNESNIIIHTIGVTRSNNENDFYRINIDFSFKLYSILSKYNGKNLIYFSSIHYNRNDIYGFSKRYNEYLFSSEELVIKNNVNIIRTPGIFGPGAKPNNVSVISTFCYNEINNISSIINEPDKKLEFLYIDDLLLLIEKLFSNTNRINIIHADVVKITVVELYNLIKNIQNKTLSKNPIFYPFNFIDNILKTLNFFKNASKQRNS
jgi:UDP-2-acetamido-2,6-beta-L-arabino-hexul-4-ose reductase